MKPIKPAPRSARGVEFEELTDEMRNEFDQRMAAYEMAEPVVLRDVLIQGGYALPEPAGVTDSEFPALIEHLAEGLELLRVYLECTNHLSDRELYVRLYDELLLEPVVIFPKDQRGALHLDIIGSGSPEDCQLYLQYYADDETRERWAKQFHDPLPPKLPQPYDRDRFLPQRSFDCFEEPVEN